jgi:hypothetical protein
MHVSIPAARRYVCGAAVLAAALAVATVARADYKTCKTCLCVPPTVGVLHSDSCFGYFPTQWTTWQAACGGGACLPGEPGPSAATSLPAPTPAPAATPPTGDTPPAPPPPAGDKPTPPPPAGDKPVTPPVPAEGAKPATGVLGNIRSLIPLNPTGRYEPR